MMIFRSTEESADGDGMECGPLKRFGERLDLMTWAMADHLFGWLDAMRRSWRRSVRSLRRRTLNRWFAGRRDFSGLRIEVRCDPCSVFVAPSAWQLATAYLPSGDEVGRVGFGVSPLGDQIYVRDLEIIPSLRRRGLAVTLLKAVVERCSSDGELLPITPIQETVDSVGFWRGLREYPVAGLTIWFPMRLCEMRHEAERWRDMALSSAEEARLIRARVEYWNGPDRWFGTEPPAGTRDQLFLRWLGRAIWGPARER